MKNKSHHLNNDSDLADVAHGVRLVEACRFEVGADYIERHPQQVMIEDVLTLDIDEVGIFNIMWTPTQALNAELGYLHDEGIIGADSVPEVFALATGFCLSEGIITHLDQLFSLAYCDKAPNVVRIKLTDSEHVHLHRKDVLVTSSCGLCTRVDIVENNIFDLDKLAYTLRISAHQILEHAQAMQAEQQVFIHTGGTHAALLFDQVGGQQPCEDLGRHNALDKVLGMALLDNQLIKGCGVMISSRISTELVLKSIRTGVEILAGVGAPTTMAIDLAARYGLTLCGFVREKRFTIYTHPQRLGIDQ
ncbi:MAG: formate dehydrogenase accessory sulfurtransferase FdhD [Gammaproteobacteria bacterium]|nr:formate dehydrogenase accessory sulfurtransferase FdhD [Gammaproteobacteria bacterium]